MLRRGRNRPVARVAPVPHRQRPVVPVRHPGGDRRGRCGRRAVVQPAPAPAALGVLHRRPRAVRGRRRGLRPRAARCRSPRRLPLRRRLLPRRVRHPRRSRSSNSRVPGTTARPRSTASSCRSRCRRSCGSGWSRRCSTARRAPRSSGSCRSRIRIADLLLVVVIVHAIFTLPRWSPAAWFLFAGLTMMLVADGVYARMLADGTYRDGGPADALWPIAYFLLAAAVMHPSMRNLWEGEPNPVRRERARMVVLGAALFAAPAVVILDDSGSSAAFTLAIITGVAAIGVAWRIVRLVDESNQARVEIGESEARFRALVQHATDVIVVVTETGTVQYISPAVDTLFGRPFEELMGTRFADYLDASGVDQTQALHQRARRPPRRARLHRVPRVRRRTDGGGSRPPGPTSCTNRPSVASSATCETSPTASARSRSPRPRPGCSSSSSRGRRCPRRSRALLHALEAYVPDGSGSIRLLDPERKTLEPVAAPSLPDEYVREVSKHTTVEDIESFLSATELHILRDIEHEGARPEINELCLSYGLRGLWSLPIRSPDGSEFLGLLGFFLRTVRDPQAGELAVLERARDLAALAIDRDARTQGARSPRAARHPHRAAQPRAGPGPARARARTPRQHRRRRDGRGAVRRPRPVQAGERRPRARDRRRAPGRGEPAPERDGASSGHRSPASAATSSSCCAKTSPAKSRPSSWPIAPRRRFVEPFTLSRAEVTVSASIGIAVTNRSSDRAANLLQDADAAMYRAKRRGGARYELFDEAMHTQAVSRLLTERALRRALDHDELRVLFQPEFDLASGRRVGARGPAPLGAPGARPRGPRRLPARRRGDRHHRADGRRGCWIAPATSCGRSATRPTTTGCSRCRPTCRPASCSDPTSRSSWRARCATPGVDPTSLCLEVAESVAARRPRRHRRRAPRAQGHRRAARDRRLRHRRLVAHLPPPLPVRRAEDRPHVRRGTRAQRGRRRDRRRHHRHGARARHGREPPRASRPRSNGCASSSSAATARRATTSARPRSSRPPRLVLVEQRPA